MKNHMKKLSKFVPTFLALLSLLATNLGLNVPAASAVDNVPAVNLNQAPTTPGQPFGAFRLVICDGPAKLNDPSTHMIKNPAATNTTTNGVAWIPDPNWKADPNFIPCNFQGLMKQAQFLINTMVVLGVFGAMIGFAYAGFLYITGTQENLKKAHAIFPKVFWGFIIMLTAWFMVYQLLKWLTPSGSNYLGGTIS